MKIVLFLAALFCCSSVFAQSPHARHADSSRFLGMYAATAGPYFTGGISTQNENIPSGWHTDPAFAYTFGGLLALEFNQWVGIQFGLAYEDRGLFMATNGDSSTADVGVQYLSIQPSLRLFWVIVGLSLNLPMSGAGTFDVQHFNTGSSYSENRNIQNADITGGMELRAGLSIPVYRGESGELKILVSGSMPLSHVLSGVSSLDSVGGSTPKPDLKPIFGHLGEGSLPTIQAGVSYQFDLNNLE